MRRSARQVASKRPSGLRADVRSPQKAKTGESAIALASSDEILGQRRGEAKTFVTAIGADITDARSSKARGRRVR